MVSYGGAQTNLTNTGTMTGRIGFGASTPGNTFVNAGTINGSVHLGNSGAIGNTFTAVSGSNVVNLGTGVAGAFGGLGISLAAAGVVDAGTGTNDRLVLQNSATGPGSGSGGAATTLDWTRYTNFEQLTVNSGTWNVLGTSTAQPPSMMAWSTSTTAACSARAC
ncbi:MAG: hypothetical protein GAK31_02774 [Stenotrophomonas maltophilia]|uniref:Uncharacterized protein n=1 Tax=Stenotrophomonas maltophilia TaxID=40324 RepID=A0A7V8JKP3_STEMA|nr:MAG: hypothetical protein GAK31_02774 [Stenotrophomonas maltophilia]